MKKSNQSSTIGCLVWNVQSINNKVDEVIQVLSDNNIQVACISETWLSDQTSITTSIIKEAGYEIDHAYRDKRGGGVAILWKNIKVKSNFSPKRFTSFQYKNIWLDGKLKINLICIYRFQEVSTKEFMKDLDTLLSEQFILTDTLILTGDFNYHYEKTDRSDVIALANLTSSYGLSQCVSGPTHKLGHTLDLLFVNKHNIDLKILESKSYGLGDHYPLIFDIPNIYCNVTRNTGPVNYRNIKSVDRNKFSTQLSKALDEKYNSSDIDSVDFRTHLEIFSECAREQLDIFAPWETRNIPTSSGALWMDTEFRKERSLRRKLERKWKKSGLPEDKQSYVSQRVKCAQLSVCKRSQYFGNLIKNSEGDQRSLYKVVSTLLDKSKHLRILPSFDNATNLANKFNNFYKDKVSDIRNNLPPANSSLPESYNISFNGTTLESFRPTTVEELRSIIKSNKIKTSSQDVIPANLLKDIIEDLLPYLVDLVNKSLSTGSVEGLKDSVIVPILKKAGLDPELLKHFRPVTNVAYISKLCEKVTLKRLNEHMSNNNLHSKFQHGYQIYHSTETLLVKLVNDVLVGFDDNMAIILLLLDLSAAFDTVDIDKLITILHNEIGIRGIALQWFKSFLVGRTQCVKIDNSLSDPIEVLFGVPQGTVLGPVLFNIYTQSLSSTIQDCGFGTSGYADDNNALMSFSLSFQYNVMTKSLPDLMTTIKEWMNQFFLKMNPDKTEIVLFVPRDLKDVPTINGCIFHEGNCIRFVNAAKNLGFILDKHLDCNTHVNSVVSLCYKLLSDVGKIRNLLSPKQTEMLVHSIVGSRLDYCNSILYGIDKVVIDKYQKVQNAAARLIVKRKKCESVRDVFKSLHWLKIEERIIFKLLVLTFKCINNMAPASLKELIHTKNASASLLVYSKLQSRYGRRSFTYIAPKLWNNLPEKIRHADKLDSFKSQLKHLLFNNFDNYMKTVFKYN